MARLSVKRNEAHNIFNNTLLKPRGRKTLVKQDYVTSDIVDAILHADKDAATDVAHLAKALSYLSDYNYCMVIYNTLREFVKYVEDEPGTQNITLPSALWKRAYGDCKSFSLFLAGCLRSRGIPYTYRFVSFKEIPVWTHVYVVANLPGRDILLDVVWRKFNSEKPYTHKKDYTMSGIYRIDGITDGAIGELKLPRRRNLNEADIDVAVVRQRFELEKQRAERMGSIGAAKARGIDQSLQVLNRFQHELGNRNFAAAYDIINGLPNPNSIGASFLKKAVKKAKSAVKTVAKTVAKGATTAAKATAKAATTVVKAVAQAATWPMREAAEHILKTLMPKAAPAFLYLFISDKATIEKLPPDIRTKRKNQEMYADFIVGALKIVGISKGNFMGIVENGIRKHYGKAPKEVLSAQLGFKISGLRSGIGASALVTTAAQSGAAAFGVPPQATSALISIIEKIAKVFGKKAPKALPEGGTTQITTAQLPEPEYTAPETADGLQYGPEALESVKADIDRSKTDLPLDGEAFTAAGQKKASGWC